jgi:predicted phosphodiesterase
MAKTLPQCARSGCTNRVTKARNQFCSHDCSRLASRVLKTPKPAKTPPSSFEVNGNSAVVTKVTTDKVKTLEQLLRVCEVDGDVWFVKKHVVNTWGNDGHFQVKAWLERKIAIVAAQAEVDDLIAHAKASIGKKPLPFKRQTLSGNMLEIGIYDPHVGKLAWGRETGNRNYDVKIAEQDFEAALEALVARTAHFEFDKIVFTLGNDLLNSDNDANTTYGGTPQSTDGRFQKTFVVVRNMAIRAIERLRTIAPVHVPMVPGNHDKQTVWHLGDSLECYFHAYEDVFIDNEPRLIKWVEFGKVMLMLTHGDKGKVKEYPSVMSALQPEMWGRTLFREAHVGHRHEHASFEKHGVRVRTLPALCPPDAWHAEQMYLGNLQSAEAFVWNATEGCVATANYNVPNKRAAA